MSVAPRGEWRPVLLYLTAFALFFLIWPARAFFSDANLPPLNPSLRWGVNFVLILWIAGYAALLRAPGKLPTPRALIAVFAPLFLLLCFLPPLFSGDLYEYLIRGRILAVYHQSPYLATPSQYPADILFPYCVWKNMPMDYGPVAAYIQALPALIPWRSVTGIVFSYKALMLVFFGATVFGVRLIAGRAGVPNAGRRAVIFALNPVLVLHMVCDAHNGLIMIALSVFAVYFCLEGKWTRCFLLWTAAFLVKQSAILILPFLAAELIRREAAQKSRRWAWLLPREAFFCLLFTAACYWPLWADLKTHLFYAEYAKFFYSNSIPYAIHQLLTLARTGLSTEVVAGACFWVAAPFCFWLLLRMRRPDDEGRVIFIGNLLLVHAAFFFQMSVPFHAWYLVWTLPWLVLARIKRQSLLIVLYTVTGLFAYFKRINYILLITAGIYSLFLLHDAWRRKRVQA